jgi:hypothetical protein
MKLKANPEVHNARILGIVSNSRALKILTGLTGALLAEPYETEVLREEFLEENRVFSDLLRRTVGEVCVRSI